MARKKGFIAAIRAMNALDRAAGKSRDWKDAKNRKLEYVKGIRQKPTRLEPVQTIGKEDRLPSMGMIKSQNRQRMKASYRRF